MRESEGRGVNFRKSANGQTEEAKDQPCPNGPLDIPLLVTGYVMGCGEIRHANSNSLIIDRHKSTILVEMSS